MYINSISTNPTNSWYKRDIKENRISNSNRFATHKSKDLTFNASMSILFEKSGIFNFIMQVKNAYGMINPVNIKNVFSGGDVSEDEFDMKYEN